MLHELIRRLARLEPTDAPVLSIYLDMRPQETGPTSHALEHGQVGVLLLDPAVGLDEATPGELVRLAVSTGATVEVVENYEPFRQLGGVGALLRYRHAAALSASL